jgi:hypothetical protein
MKKICKVLAIIFISTSILTNIALIVSLILDIEMPLRAYINIVFWVSLILLQILIFLARWHKFYLFDWQEKLAEKRKAKRGGGKP